jgi:signal transduction histidine kinase
MAKHQIRPPWRQLTATPTWTSSVRRRIRVLQWVVPLGLVLAVVIYQLGPARWVLETFGLERHLIAEILIFAVVGPVLAYWLLHFLNRWIEEREVSELQAQLLAQTREQTRMSYQLSDKALQTLFAASVLLSISRSSLGNLSPDQASTLQQTEEALNSAIQQIRDHLENGSARELVAGRSEHNGLN